MRARLLTVAAAAVCAAATLGVAVAPQLRFAYESPELRSVLEATQALIGAVTAYLVYGRVRRSAMRNDLVVVYALALFASTNLFFIVLPHGGETALTFQTWARLATRMIGTAALAWAAIAPDRRIRHPKRAGIVVVTTADFTLAAVAVIAAAFVRHLPAGIEVAVDDAGKAIPALWGHPATVVGELIVFSLFLVAAVGFASRADHRPDPLVTALAVGSAIAAFSWLHFAAYPSIFSDVVQLGDVLRVAFYLVLLIGAQREIETWWSRLARATASEERRRMARDLHDGLAQELAFITRESRLLERGEASPEAASMIAASAERALDEARAAISALTNDRDEPLGLAIAHAAEEIAGRVGTEVRLDIAADIDVAPSTREALLRIVRESVTNAGRHGHATHVVVALGEDRVLSIEDDGCGFDLDEAATKGRFGLVSMRERAEGLGGRFRIMSGPGRGTRVEVGLP
jgi:signal transduction histidine kinase